MLISPSPFTERGPGGEVSKRIVTLAVILFLLLSPLTPAAASPRRQGASDRVTQIMAGMSVRQKVAQMFMISLWGEVLTDVGRDFLQTANPGAVALFEYNTGTPEAITRLTNDIQQTGLAAPNGIPAFIAIDQEGGLVSRLSEEFGFTTFPVMIAVAATGNPDDARAIGQAMAEELRAVGISMNLAPVADLETNPDNPIIARRAFGSDPELVGTMVAALIDGLQANGVLATAKHFPGHGDTTDDSHTTLPVVPLDAARLEAVELAPFRAAIAADVSAIMAAHVVYPALDPAPNIPASLSGPILTGLLREDMGFVGLIMTDALDMDAIDTMFSLPRAAVLAVQAGVDFVVPGPHAGWEAQLAAYEAVVAAVERGEIPLERIDESVRRILTLKEAYGVLDWTPLDPLTAAERVNHAAHQEIVARVLADAITLVYDDHHLVPLDANRPLALIYPATQPTIRAACEAYDPDLRVVGVSQWPTAEEVSWAVGAAQQSDMTAVLTLDADENTAQQALVNALPPDRTVVLALRSPYDWQAFPDVAAYLTAYSPLPPAIPVACAALFGAQPITGVLPIKLSDDLPAGSGVRRP